MHVSAATTPGPGASRPGATSSWGTTGPTRATHAPGVSCRGRDSSARCSRPTGRPHASRCTEPGSPQPPAPVTHQIVECSRGVVVHALAVADEYALRPHAVE